MPHVPFFVLVAQNSGVRTRAALRGSFVSGGAAVCWAPAEAHITVKSSEQANVGARREQRVCDMAILLKEQIQNESLAGVGLGDWHLKANLLPRTFFWHVDV